MNGPEILSGAIGLLEEDIVNEAAALRLGRRSPRKKAALISAVCAAAAAACITVFAGGGEHDLPAAAKLLAKAEYPAAAQYPDEKDFINGNADNMLKKWREQRDARNEAASALGSGIYGFCKKASAEVMSESGDNLIFSPVSAYMAMSMLAETTGGESREQLLAALGADDPESLRSQAKNLWLASYRDDGAVASVIADSLWLDSALNCRKKTADILASDYYASTYTGKLDSPEMNGCLRKWLSDQTGGILGDSVENTSFPENAAMALCSTLYFHGNWDYFNYFNPNRNEVKIFRGKKGDAEAEFMNCSPNALYYYGEDYGAVRLDFSCSSSMWFILPDEDKTVDDVISSGEYLDMISLDGDDLQSGWEKTKELEIYFSVPKFDISSEVQLGDMLKYLGVTDIFNGSLSDFTPLTDSEDLYVSEVKQASRVMIDEEGCTAASFTMIAAAAGGAPADLEKMDFILDRPFIFVITGDTRQPLFIGRVNDL